MHKLLLTIYLGFGDYKWKTYAECFRNSEAVARYLMANELCPKVTNPDGTFRFVALYSKNRVEWTESDFGCAMTSIAVVTLYDTLGKDSTQFILNETHIKTAIMSADKINGILDMKDSGKIPELTHIIYFDEASAD